jgi:predicted dinucleotide-binding enzyme
MPKSTTVGRLAVIGTGKIGQAAGKLWLHAGYDVVFGSRNPAGPAAALAELGATVATPLEAARAADVVLLAVPGETVEELLPELSDALAGKMVIDATNKIGFADGRWVSTLEPGRRRHPGRVGSPRPGRLGLPPVLHGDRDARGRRSHRGGLIFR